MAGESVINGVTKIEIEGGFSYLFPIANIITNTVNDSITYKYFTVGNTPAFTISFSDITNNYGATDAETYVDVLATIGAYNNQISTTPSGGDISFLANRIVVTQASQLLGTLDSTKQYFIDGVIDMGSQSIEVPIAGLSISGYGFELSQLISTSNTYSMFTSPLGGSGNLLLSNLAVTTSGTSSQVFNLIDSDGTHAIEHNTVNFNACTSLGEITDYRQGLELNTGRFGGTPELTLSGTMNGYRATTSITRGLSNITSLFKTGTELNMSGRFITDMNCELPAIGAFIDFAPSNIVNDESLIIKGAFITREGVIDASDTTIHPNIDQTSVKSKWSDNTGVPNTTKYIKVNLTTEVVTTIAVVSTYYPLLGTWTIEKASHFDMPANGEIRLLSGNGTYQVVGDIPIDSNPNNELSIRVTKSIDGGATYPTEVNNIKRVVNNLSGGRDVAFFTINFLTDLKKNDRLRLEIENQTGANNVIAELDSFFTIIEV